MKIKLNENALSYCPLSIREANTAGNLYLIDINENGNAFIGTSPTGTGCICTFVNTCDIYTCH